VGIIAKACGTTLFKACAPRLPPITSTRNTPLRPAKRCSGAAWFRNAARMGLPTHWALGNTPGNADKTLSAICASTLLERPATEFCSCNTSGLPQSTPIMPPGKLM